MKRRRNALVVISYVLVIGASVVFLFPIAWLVLNSFKLPSEMLEISLPTQPTLVNYSNVLGTFPVGRYLRNSLFVALSSTFFSLIFGSLAAYGFTRYRFFGRRTMLVSTLLMRMLPAMAIGIPLFIMFSRLRMTNTFSGLIIAHVAVQLPLIIWIMLGFLEDISVELAEAGMVDGCNRLTVLYRIILPLATPGLAVAAIFAFLVSWNDFGLALILISTPDLLTMPVGMANMNLMYGVRWDSLSTAAVMYIVPTVIMALLLQRYIVRGLTMGAVKG